VPAARGRNGPVKHIQPAQDTWVPTETELFRKDDAARSHALGHVV
jgi:hypothetical protein